MEDMNVRIQRITEDLRAIQQELNFAAMQAPDDPEQSELVGEISNVNALENLKSAIDQMRHFLWFYFQVLNNESDVRERMRQALPSSTVTSLLPWIQESSRAACRLRHARAAPV